MVARFGQVAKATESQRHHFIVVVENDPPVLRDPEILEQEVAGKNIRVGEIADRVP